jgi:hypothetical protein
MLSPIPWNPVFGHGAPGGTVPTSAQYFDIDTTPYTAYLYRAGGWHQVSGGGSGGTGDATKLQGRAISATSPTNGQVMTWDAGNSLWKPQAPAGGPVPSIIQTKGASGGGYSVTLAGAPTNGNLLVALSGSQDINPGANAGWTKSPYSIGSAAQDNAVMWYKICGAGESATQVPSGSGAQTAIQMWELASALMGVPTLQVDLSGTGSAFAVNSQKATGAILLGMFVNRNAAVAPTIAGATIGTLTQASNRTIAPWVQSSPTVGANNVTPTYGSSQGYMQAAVQIG